MIKNTLVAIAAFSALSLGSAFASSYTYSNFFFYGENSDPTVSQVHSGGSISTIQADDSNVFVMPTGATPTTSFGNYINITFSYQNHTCQLSFNGLDLAANTAPRSICCPNFDNSLQAGVLSFKQDHLISSADLRSDGSFNMPANINMHMFINSCAS